MCTIRYISNAFSFDQDTLKLVLEQSCNATEIVFYWWNVGKLDKTFCLDPEIEYSIVTLDLYETCKKKEFLDKKKVKRLIKALAKTNIKKTLKKVHIRAQFFPEEKLIKKFHKRGFRIRVKANEKEPKVK